MGEPARNEDLHGNVPDKSDVALLLIDVINDLEFESGFFSTTLDTPLDYLQAKTLILTGLAGNTCVLFTANDAYMRDFRLVIPADRIASNTAPEKEQARASRAAGND